MPVIADKDVPAMPVIADRFSRVRAFLRSPRLGSDRAASASRSMVIPQPRWMICLQSIRDHGILVPLVVARGTEAETWQVVSGHRRLACCTRPGTAQAVPCEVRTFSSDTSRHLAVLEYNRQRQKNFSQTMREADALEELWKNRAKSRRLANLRRGQFEQGLCFRTRRLSKFRRSADS